VGQTSFAFKFLDNGYTHFTDFCCTSLGVSQHAKSSLLIPLRSRLGARQRQAHFPSNAIKPAPRHMVMNAAMTVLILALRIELLNMNSCAINSTNPV
jgi:hypothetical protein